MWEPQKFSKFREEARKKAKTLRSDLKWSWWILINNNKGETNDNKNKRTRTKRTKT
jgi:hypothetical protein